MAVELCSEASSSCVAAMSPRISFSYDLSHQTEADDVPPIEQYIRSNSSSSSVDFDFCVFRESFDQEYSSSADELFFDGKILPIEIKKKLGGAPNKKSSSPSQSPPPPPSRSPLEFDIDFHHSSSGGGTTRKSKKKEKPREQNSNSSITDSEEKQNSSSSNKSWFKRSSSLNCGSGYARSLCPIPLLSRSNSTGSTPSVKRSSSSSLMKEKDNNINYNYISSNKQKFYHQKPPLKKSYTTTTTPPTYGNGNGIKVNPVLNVPTPSSFFGLASIFSISKDKNKKK